MRSKSPAPPITVRRFCTPCRVKPAVSSKMKALSSAGIVRSPAPGAPQTERGSPPSCAVPQTKLPSPPASFQRRPSRPPARRLRYVLKSSLEVPVQLLAQFVEPPPHWNVNVLIPPNQGFLPQAIAGPPSPGRRVTVVALGACSRKPPAPPPCQPS